MLLRGLFPDLALEDVFTALPKLLDDVAVVQISRIDSTSPRRISEVDDQAWCDRYRVTRVDDDIAVPVASFERLLHVGFFGGFDEVWLLGGAPIAMRPPDLILTSDRPISGLDAASLERWLQVSGARVGLGDGIGLNYATSSPDLAATLRSAG
jgi:hypothetical protein